MTQMRAVRITQVGGPEVLQLGEVPIPTPSRGEVRVRIRAAGVNRADLLQRRGFYPAPPGWPSEVPGLEYAGEVESVGAGVEMWEVGDGVMGLVGGGSYAEYTVVSEREVMALPDGLSFEQGAAIPEVFVTAHDALFTRLELSLGERLLIHAVGSGVGTAALQLAKVAGATVFGTSRTDWKLDRAREELGLDRGIDASRADFATAVREETGGEGVEAIVDLVGAPYLEGNLRCLVTRGRMVVVGLPGGRSGEIDLGTLLRKRLHVIGTALRTRPLEERIEATRAFDRRVGSLLASGKVRPIVDRVFALEEVADAHRHMEANANFGKIVLRIAHD